MMKELDMVFKRGEYWIAKDPCGYLIFKTGPTCSTKVSTIGFKGGVGLMKAMAELARRLKADKQLQGNI
jgi:hypothetical protein